MITNKIKSFLLISTLTLSMSSSQTTHQIAAGTDVLGPAITAAASGDIIELITDGGVYLNSSQFVIDKDITIRGADDLVDKPILKYIGTSTGAYFFKNTHTSNTFTLENLEFDGDGTAEGGAALAKYLVRLDNGTPSGTSSLYMDNCITHDFNEKFIKPYGNNGMDVLSITNSIFYNGAKEAIVLYSGSSSDPAAPINDVLIENCTFYGIAREAVKGQTYADASVLINRCTFYDIGSSGKGIVYFRDMTDVVVKNSIFTNNYGDADDEFADFDSDVSLFHNSVVFDVLNNTVRNATVSDTMHVDPEFADAANADFNIPEGSALLTFADDGGSIGDSRWTPSEGPFTLAVFTVGNGSVALNPAGGIYDEGTVVTMTATPADLWLFDHWSDNVFIFPPDNPVATATVDQNMAVTAYFIPSIDEYSINISSIGYGHVEDTLFSDYGTLDGYFEGDSLVLTPVVDSTNWVFAYWVNEVGDSIDNASPLSYIVHDDTAFTAKFWSTLAQYTLALTVVGADGGDVVADPLPVPGFDTYDAGTVVTLVADTELGWEFGGFSGDVVDNNDTVSVTINSDVSITVTFNEISHPDGILSIDDEWELLDAVEYAHNNSQVNTIKLTTVGPYEPSESLRDPSNGRMPMINIHSPVSIVGDPALESKPVVRGYTSTSNSTSSEGFFRLRAGSGKLTLKYLSIDGYLDPDSDAKPAKYLFRADDGADTVFCSLDAENVDFKSTVEAFWKNYPFAYVDTMRFENCQVSDIGKEAIFLNSVGTANYVELKNSTFSNVGREILYLKNLPDTRVNIDHVTVSDCGYGYGTEGDKFGAVRIEQTTDVQLHNMIINNVTNTIYGYALRYAGSESVLDNVLLNNTSMNIDNRDSATVGGDVFWYDPLFVGPDTGNFTLADSSLAYYMASDNSAAIGDLRWATSTNIASYHALNLDVSGGGSITSDPLPMAKFYLPNTVVTLTAVPDSGFEFIEWTGDLTGSDNPTTITMDEVKSITAVFEEETVGIDNELIPKEYSLSQNYPNPFNPNTTINFALKNPGRTTLKLYDLMGKQVATLFDQEMNAGFHSIAFNDRTLASGMYFYRIVSGDFVATRKMLLMK